MAPYISNVDFHIECYWGLFQLQYTCHRQFNISDFNVSELDCKCQHAWIVYFRFLTTANSQLVELSRGASTGQGNSVAVPITLGILSVVAVALIGVFVWRKKFYKPYGILRKIGSHLYKLSSYIYISDVFFPFYISTHRNYSHYFMNAMQWTMGIWIFINIVSLFWIWVF